MTTEEMAERVEQDEHFEVANDQFAISKLGKEFDLNVHEKLWNDVCVALDDEHRTIDEFEKLSILSNLIEVDHFKLFLGKSMLFVFRKLIS